MVDKHMGHSPDATQAAMSPYGAFDDVVDMLAAQLASGPFLLGERFTAADLIWGTAIGWTLAFGLLPDRPVFAAYAGRIAGRASARKVADEDAALAAMRRP